MKQIAKALASLTVAMLYVGCAPARPTYFDVQPKEKIAIGNFSVNGYITKKGDERLTPGLLQNKASFYQYTQKAIDSAAQVMFVEIPKSLSDVEVIQLSDLSANTGYQRVSRPAETKMLGTTISDADGFVYPDVVGYVKADQNKIDAMLMALGVDALVTIDFDANLEPAMVGNETASISVGIGSVSLLSIATRAEVTLYRKGKGQVWKKYFDMTGKENALAVGPIVAEANLPRLFVSSIETLPAKLAEELNKSRNRPAAPAAK